MKETLRDRLNIGIFGDSIGKGIVLGSSSAHYELVKTDLEEILEKQNISLRNFSMMGCTILKGLSVVKRRMKEVRDCRNILLEFGGNDCDMDWKAISEKPEEEHIPKTPIAEFVRLYTQVIEEIRNNSGSPIMLTIPPLAPEKYYEWVSRKLRKDNILAWLGNIDTIYRWQEMYNLNIVMLAAKLAVPIIDIRSTFLKNHYYQNLLCEDGIHPNKAGYELIYRTIAEQYT